MEMATAMAAATAMATATAGAGMAMAMARAMADPSGGAARVQQTGGSGHSSRHDPRAGGSWRGGRASERSMGRADASGTATPYLLSPPTRSA
jgi:hypothetical protein